jgi:type IV secretory pathway ATPase VirB11/archaellum biosynthesis ATPase
MKPEGINNYKKIENKPVLIVHNNFEKYRNLIEVLSEEFRIKSKKKIKKNNHKNITLFNLKKK